jgi:hypothetical protein
MDGEQQSNESQEPRSIESLYPLLPLGRIHSFIHIAFTHQHAATVTLRSLSVPTLEAALRYGSNSRVDDLELTITRCEPAHNIR